MVGVVVSERCGSVPQALRKKEHRRCEPPGPLTPQPTNHDRLPGRQGNGTLTTHHHMVCFLKQTPCTIIIIIYTMLYYHDRPF